MDSVTQFLLGAAVGDGCYRRKIGKSAKWWGGIAGLLPDIDIFFYRTPFDFMTVHRGYSHSLIVTILGGILWGTLFFYAINYLKRQGQLLTVHNQLGDWCGLFVLGLVTHPLLDVCTTYGTQLMLPFNNNRYALDAVGIVDPFYSLWLLGGLLIGPFIGHKINNRFAQVALVISTLYLGYCYWINQQAIQIVQQQLIKDKIDSNKIHCYPTLLQPYLRNIVVQNDKKFYVSTISMWRKKAVNRWIQVDKAQSHQIDLFNQHPIAQTFNWFANHQVQTQQWQIGPATYKIRLSDMRYTNWFNCSQSMWGIEGTVNAKGVVENLTVYRRAYIDNNDKDQNTVAIKPAVYWQALKKIGIHIWTQAFVNSNDSILNNRIKIDERAAR